MPARAAGLGLIACLALGACGGDSQSRATSAHAAADADLTWTRALAQAPFVGRDGAGALEFVDPADGIDKAWLLGGWNSAERTHFTSTGAPGCCTTNEVWKSSDGINWQLAKPNTPDGWESRHMAGWVVFAGRMWVIGGDDNSGHYQTDIWNSADGVHWTQVAASVPWA